MPTKEHKRHARGILEALESRAYAGPSVADTELLSARAFLEQNDFSPSSDYFRRLLQLKDRLVCRPQARVPQQKRNYGGESAGCWMQLQSIYDHLILSVCYDGEFNSQRGRVKVSHRFNQAGRIDFVELKFLRSLQPCLTGEIRKLITIKDYQHVRNDWLETEAHVLRVLPQELIFLYHDLFRCSRADIVAWLINIGHRCVTDLMGELQAGRVNGCERQSANPNQLMLATVDTDVVAMPILQQAAALETTVDANDSDSAVVRYVHK